MVVNVSAPSKSGKGTINHAGPGVDVSVIPDLVLCNKEGNNCINNGQYWSLPVIVCDSATSPE